MEHSVKSAFDLLCDSHKLNRDKGFENLKSSLSSLAEDDKGQTAATIEKIIPDNLSKDGSWEVKFGSLEAGKVLLMLGLATESFVSTTVDCALRHIADDEFRVRIASGEFLGHVCRYSSPDIYKKVEPELIQSIRSNLERGHIKGDVLKGEYSLPTRDIDAFSVELAKEAASGIFHDTAGWRCLETSMKGLQSVIEGCGTHFIQFLTQDLLDLIFETLEHTNRFVRETGYYLCSALVRYGITSSGQLYDEAAVSKVTGIENLGAQLANHLRKGLSDNWSQVRMAASVATRHFFMDIDDKEKEAYYTILLPPLCLNRYYLAEGVRLYNQETWRLVTRDLGKVLVERHMEDIIKFYVDQTKSDNHAVREAACHCMEELSGKVEKSYVEPYVLELLDALLVCFRDQSWPVRDTACVACGNFVLAFPAQCKGYLDQLFPLFFDNLADPISSVRQGGAVALCNVYKAYGKDVSGKILEKVKEGLKGVANQRETAERFEGFEKGPGTYSVTKRLLDNDPNLHSNQQMYSCGSLAPKMKRGGCSDCEVHRPSELWEIADGCFYLLGELASVTSARMEVTQCIPAFTKAAMYTHYHQHVYLLETFCWTVIKIAQGFGKQKFKSLFELLIEPLFLAVKSENQLTKAGACDCFDALNHLMGPQIVRGRIESYDPILLHILDREINTAG